MTLRPVSLVVRPLQTLPAAKRRVQARREASNPAVPPSEQDQQGRESAGRAREGAGKREGRQGQGRAWEQAGRFKGLQSQESHRWLGLGVVGRAERT